MQKESNEVRKRILSSSVKLFIENGYSNTTVEKIINDAEVSGIAFENIFQSKSALLLDLIEFMYSAQFKNARTIADSYKRPVYIYALETAMQLAITEMNENLREIYLEAYTNPEIVEYLHRKISTELYNIFGGYKPEYKEGDFYELEIGTFGIMRSYMSKRCDQKFTLEKKITRFIELTLSVYGVSNAEIKDITRQITAIDIKDRASNIIQELFEKLAVIFNFKIIKTDELI